MAFGRGVALARPPKILDGFTPLTVPGLNLWARADLGITLTSSQVSKWADQSGSGDDFISVAPNQPGFATVDATANGGSVLVMSGAQKMNTAAETVAQPVTIMWVGYLTTLAGNPGLIDNPTLRQLGYVGNVGTTWNMDAGATLQGGTPNNAFHTFIFEFDGATSKLYIDTAAAPVLNGNAGGGSGTGGFIIGTQSTGFMHGAISEVARWPRVLTLTEKTNLFAYVASGRPSKAPASSLTFDGNSIVEGFAASPPSTKGFCPLAAARFGAVNYNNAGLSGATTPQCDTIAGVSTDPQFSALRAKNVNVMLEVTNDYLSGSTAAQCVAHLGSYVTARHLVGWDVGMCTVLPSYVFTDAVGGEADRATINTAIRGGATGADFVVDIAADPIMGNAANINNATYYQGRLHPTTLGHSILAPILYAALVPRM